MSSFIKRKGYITLLCMIFLLQHLAFAYDVRLTNIIVTNTRDDLLVYLTVEGAFSEKMKKAVLNGVAADFSFYINLYQSRNWWIDKKIAGLKITHTIKYNNLKKEFHIKRSWVSDKTIVAQTFEEAQKLMSEINSLKIVPLGSLQKGGQYQIRAKAEIGKLTLPFYLHYVLFFVSLWDVETDWHTTDFIY
ncbi:MAG: hypothetical protein SRB1_02494 [Desulfobacteraceae bacterium Eth-SRB1]|nr:MAG: hypothetical protein SRB1_02494 [Desulfobacteraceae bacterium Eth-SRB1]